MPEARLDDASPQRAADIANRYVDELRRLTNRLVLTEAQQRRVFFEQQLNQTKQKLTQAQQALLASGFQRMLFLTTDRNTPVHRLFTLDEIISTETFPTRLWLRNPPPPLKRES